MKNGYGFDRLSRDALIASAAFSLLGVLLWRGTAGMILCAVSTLLMGLILFRTLSADTRRRQDELIGYEAIVNSIKGFFSRIFGGFSKKGAGADASGAGQAKDPAYKYFKCPDCGREYRAPRGKGKIRVTCRQCGKQFEKKV